MADKNKKTKIYHEILAKKRNLTVFKNDEFKFEFPKESFDRICKFYGKLTLNPISFVKFNLNVKTIELKKMKTVSHALDEIEIRNVLELSEYYAIVPKNFKEKYNEAQIAEFCPKIKNKAMKNIMKKSGLILDLLLDYCEFQIISKEVQVTSKTTVTYEIIDNIFKYIPLLNVKLINGEKSDFSFYSLKTILEKCGINLEKMIPYLHHEIKNIDRTKLNKESIPLYEKVKLRELKERIINGDLKEQNFGVLYIGSNHCRRYSKVPFDIVEHNGDEIRRLLENKENINKNEKNEKNLNINKEIREEKRKQEINGKEEMKERLRNRISNAKNIRPEKNYFTIRRAIVYRKKNKNK